MAIPKYNEMYREFLQCLADQKPHSSKELKDFIANSLSVSDEERQVLQPSGRHRFLTTA